MEKKHIVYILGLSHVGSTLLDLTLSSHPRFIGLGEAFCLLRDLHLLERKIYCSCGKMIHDCPFWGVAADRLLKNRDKNLPVKYKILMEVFNEVFEESQILVDSSKRLDDLKVLMQIPEIDIKVIYLIRDVRAWTISRLNNRKLFPRYFEKDGHYTKRLASQYGKKIYVFRRIIPYLTRMPAYFFLLWYYQNKNIKKYLETQNISKFYLGYDELGMQPETMVPKIFQFLGEEKKDGNFSTESSRSHILVGSVKKDDPKRRETIFYDNRWIYRNEWLLPAALFRNVMKYNAKEVYQNIRSDSIWH